MRSYLVFNFLFAVHTYCTMFFVVVVFIQAWDGLVPFVLRKNSSRDNNEKADFIF